MDRARQRAPKNPYSGVPAVPERVDLDALARGREVEIDLGFGRGHFVLARAAARPGALLIGLELRRKWVGVVAGRAARAGLDNVLLWYGDARSALARFAPDGAVSWIFVHFPDPWWKKRHEKRLLLVGPTVREIQRLLGPGGRLLVQTDVADRAAAYGRVLAAEPGLRQVEIAPGTSPIPEQSHRESKCLEAGLEVHRLLFEKI